MPASVLMHILICLSYLNKSPAVRELIEGEGCKFSDRISEFVEYFSKLPLEKLYYTKESKQEH